MVAQLKKVLLAVGVLWSVAAIAQDAAQSADLPLSMPMKCATKNTSGLPFVGSVVAIKDDLVGATAQCYYSGAKNNYNFVDLNYQADPKSAPVYTFAISSRDIDRITRQWQRQSQEPPYVYKCWQVDANGNVNPNNCTVIFDGGGRVPSTANLFVQAKVMNSVSGNYNSALKLKVSCNSNGSPVACNRFDNVMQLGFGVFWAGGLNTYAIDKSVTGVSLGVAGDQAVTVESSCNNIAANSSGQLSVILNVNASIDQKGVTQIDRMGCAAAS